jgi:hypothetical protein
MKKPGGRFDPGQVKETSTGRRDNSHRCRRRRRLCKIAHHPCRPSCRGRRAAFAELVGVLAPPSDRHDPDAGRDMVRGRRGLTALVDGLAKRPRGKAHPATCRPETDEVRLHVLFSCRPSKCLTI